MQAVSSNGFERYQNFDAYDRLNKLSFIRGNTAQHYQFNYDAKNRLDNVGLPTGKTLSYEYDGLNRVTKQTLNTSSALETSYLYHPSSLQNTTTPLVWLLTNKQGAYEYNYDVNGNIITVEKLGATAAENITEGYYVYDALNQLTSALVDNDVYTYTYDCQGNLQTVKKNGTTIGNYQYTDPKWADKLTQYNEYTITYDNIGNPLQYRNGITFTWKYGRSLKYFDNAQYHIFYRQNADGYRVEKHVTNNSTSTTVAHYYDYNGTDLICERWGSNTLWFLRDAGGSPIGLNYNGLVFYYVKNLQGDVTGIVDASGTLVAEYTYDAWGNPLSTVDLNGSNIANINPLRYRGYYYDTETGLYYVSSRYYDPEIGRWINADNQIAGVGGEVLGYNMFAYCMNNPVNMSDPSGNWPKWATKLVAAVAVVAVVAVVAAVTVATAGAGTAIAAVAVGAAKGAAIGFAVGAATGAAGGAISHRISTGSWDGAGEAALNGMANGALSGAVSGAISGGITGGLSYNSGVTSAGKGFDTYRQLKNEIGSPGAGNEWHHIVEQSQIAKSGFSPQMIQNTNNIMSISKTTHRAISGYYSSVQPFTNGMIVRNWLAGQSFSAQYEFGINVIKMFM